jgi:hypothetical protein
MVHVRNQACGMREKILGVKIENGGQPDLAFAGRLGSPYRSGRSRDWIKSKNPAAPAVKREAEEDWGKETWR